LKECLFIGKYESTLGENENLWHSGMKREGSAWLCAYLAAPLTVFSEISLKLNPPARTAYNPPPNDYKIKISSIVESFKFRKRFSDPEIF